MSDKTMISLKKDKSDDANFLSLLQKIFLIKKDKNGVVSPASLSKEDQKKIINFNENIKIDYSSVEKFCFAIEISDSNFNATTEIATLALDRSNKMASKLRETILDFCVYIVSTSFIFKIQNTNNIFSDISNETGDYLSKLNYFVNEKYERRLIGLKKINENKENNPIQEKSTDSKYLNEKLLKLQKKNIVIIGVIYGLFKEKVSYKEAIFFMKNHYYNGSLIEEMNVATYLIKNRQKNEIKNLLQYFDDILERKEIEQKTLKQQMDLKNKEYNDQKISFEEEKKLNIILSDKSTKLLSEIEELKNQIDDLRQDEKAKRVHLHDDSERAKARAINLLSEDVLEPIKICLSVLRRDNPMVDVALDHIERIEENVERGLQWFKK